MNARIFISLLVLAAVGGAVYYWNGAGKTAAPLFTPIKATSPNDASAAANHYPVAESEDEAVAAAPSGATRAPLPTIDESDQTIQEGLIRIFTKVQFEALFNNKDIVRRIVVTVDGLTGRLQSPPEFLPVKSAEGAFLASSAGSEYFISPGNSERYARYVALVQAMDTRKFVGMYKHFYPLFQAAYSDLGTKGYFNDRLVEIVDELLKTPEQNDPVKLVLPSVFYKYADAQTEALSAGQRLLLRMGSGNAKIIKTKLREVRGLLTKK